MDLFSFIHHADPTKSQIGERHIKEEQVPLLDSTEGHVIPLAGEDSQAGSVVRVDHGGQNDNDENLNKGSGDADQGDHFEDSDHVGQDEAVTIVVGEEFWVAVADELKTVEVGLTAVATVPFVTSSVTSTPKRKGDSKTDFGFETNLRTQRPSKRSLVPPLLMTVAIATTVVAGTPSASVTRAGAEPVSQVHQSIFVDFASIGATCQMLQLFSEFNVGAVCQTCLSYEVRLWSEHNFRERKKFKRKYAGHVDLLKERDVEIANLKAQLSLKEAEAIEAIHLSNQVSVVKAVKSARVIKHNILKEHNSALEEKKNALERKVTTLEFAASAKETELASLTAASFESQKDGFTNQVSLLETTCSGLHDQVSGYELFKEQCEAIQDGQVKVLSDRVAVLDFELMALALHLDKEFYPRFLTTIADRRWIIGHGLMLAVMKCHQSPGYGVAFEVVIGLVIDFRNLEFKILSQLESQKDATIVDIMSLLHLEGPSTETLEYFRSTSQVTAVTTTALAISVTAANISSILPILVATYDMPNAGVQDTAPHSSKIVFEREDLETTPKHPSAS
nr:hypothetical protein [Tanacetum cinerariifolium]